MNIKLIEDGMISIYENNEKEKLINARELFVFMRGSNTKTKFIDWIKEKVEKYGFEENIDFISFSLKNEKPLGGRPAVEYYLKIDTAKEISMVENNDKGRKIRKYFIEIEKRYRQIVSIPSNIFDFMRLALDQIEVNEKRIHSIEVLSENTLKEIEKIKQKIDIIIKNDYCLASDISEQLSLYSESNLPHSNLIGAVARQLGYKISYKHYYEDEYIAIVTDLSKGNDFWQVFYKPLAVSQIIDWFNTNKNKIFYKIIYERNSKNGIKGEVKEQGYKIDNVCYKVKI